MALLQRDEVGNHQNQRKDHHQRSVGAAEPIARQSFIGIDHKINGGAESKNIICHADDAGNIEGGDGDGEHPDHRRKQRRPDQRQLHAEQRFQFAHAVHVGGFDEGGIHTTQRGGNHHVGERRQGQALDETDASQGRHIERSGLEIKQLHQKNIDNTDARMAKKNPTHRLEKSRKENADAQEAHGQSFVGKSVRSMNQANKKPRGIATAIVTPEKIKVVTMTR